MASGLNLAVAAFGGHVLAQTSLLGLWAGLGSGKWFVRLICVIVGLDYLGMLFCGGVRGFRDINGELIAMFELAGLTVAGLLEIFFSSGIRIRGIGDDGSETNVSQFSIRQLLLFTLVVACLSAVSTCLPLDRRILAALTLLSSPFVILGLVAVWGILATNRPGLNIFAVSLLAPAFGFGLKEFPYYSARPSFWITATTTAASALVVSLYAIRRCGFRA